MTLASVRALIVAARAAQLHTEARASVAPEAPAVPVLVYVPPFRFAPYQPAAVGTEVLEQGPGESLEAFAKRAWAVSHPIAKAWLVAGVIPIPVRVDEPAPDLIARLQDLRDLLVIVPQLGRRGADVLADLKRVAA